MSVHDYGVDAPPNPMHQPLGASPTEPSGDPFGPLRPSAVWYWVGGAIAVVGVAVAVVLGVRAFVGVFTAVDDWPRVAVPGQGEVYLDAGSYRVYAEGPGFGTGGSTSFFASYPDVRISDPQGRPVPVRSERGTTETYEWGSRSGTSFARFTAPVDGFYLVSTEASVGATHVAISEGLFDGVLGQLGLAVLVGALSVIVGGVVLIVTGVRRGREKRRRGPPPGAGYPAGNWGGPPDPRWAPPAPPQGFGSPPPQQPWSGSGPPAPPPGTLAPPGPAGPPGPAPPPAGWSPPAPPPATGAPPRAW